MIDSLNFRKEQDMGRLRRVRGTVLRLRDARIEQRRVVCECGEIYVGLPRALNDSRQGLVDV